MTKRKYQSIWEAIKTAPVKTGVQVKCHGTASKTLRQGVLKEKSAETAVAKRLGIAHAGKLEITEQTATPSGYVIVTFKLQWDGRRL
jgi:hypothetical protein